MRVAFVLSGVATEDGECFVSSMSKCFWCINIPHSALTLFLSSTIAVGLYIYWSKDEKKCISDNAKVLGIQVTRAQGNRKRLHFVRHAEGYHNLYGEANHDEYLREDLEDAILTPKGRSQCAALAEEVQASGAVANAQLLVVSPMNRTLDTALYSFPFLKGKVPWIAVEALREQVNKEHKHNPCEVLLAFCPLRHISNPIIIHILHYLFRDMNHFLCTSGNAYLLASVSLTLSVRCHIHRAGPILATGVQLCQN